MIRQRAPRWNHVLFDLDGTLANTIPLIVASYQHAFREVLGEEVDEARARAWIGRPLLAALVEESPDHGVALDHAYRVWNLANTEGLIDRYAGVPELLDELGAAGVRSAIVTSKRRETARLALAAVGIADRIEVVAALEDTQEHKPAPEPLWHGCRALGVAPASAVYVGDATVDIASARAAGLASIAVTWGAGTRADLRAEGPDHLCDTVDDLRALLLNQS